MKILRFITLGLLCLSIAVLTSCEMNEYLCDCQKQNPEEPCECPCDPAPVVEEWTKAWYDAFGVAYNGSAKVEIASGITLEKTQANNHELVFNNAAAGAIALVLKNENVYQAYTFYTPCAENYTFDGKDISGIKYGTFAPCECIETPECKCPDCPKCECPNCPECECPNCPDDGTITCTQAYYPTDGVRTIHYDGYSSFGNDNTNYAGHNSRSLESGIWTSLGTPCIVRFYINFDLSDYNHTEKTLIENTFLYLYGHPTFSNHSSNKTNRHVFNRVISEWDEKAITWNHQPNVDETTSIITDHIPGTLDEPRRDDYIFNLNDILLEDKKLKVNYNGISCRPYQENIYDYYRRVAFANHDFEDKAYHPTLKVEYSFPLPKIKFKNNVFSITNNDDLKTLFNNVQYIWTINGEKHTGESILFKTTAHQYNVHLQIVITNNINEISKHDINRTF